PQGRIEMPPPSRLRTGDWLIVPDARLAQQYLALDGAPLELIPPPLRLESGLPVRTTPGFYGGRVPLEHQAGPFLEGRVYRVRADFTPRPGERPPFRAGR